LLSSCFPVIRNLFIGIGLMPTKKENSNNDLIMSALVICLWLDSFWELARQR
jgi:hypothetical protein